ncbi:MAG: peptidoglycan-binding domain-containing protein [Bacteroidota bacterium]
MFTDTLGKTKALFSLLLLFGLFAHSHAQDQLFTVQIGLFQDVSLEDFASLSTMGFIYAQEVEANVHQVYIGNFSDRVKAQSVVDRLQGRNFRNAILLEQPLNTGSDIAVVQLASQRLGSDLNWEELGRAGTLYVQSDDQILKIMTGVYNDRAQAQADVQRIRGLGYSDAFVKIINNYRLVPVTDWETGVKEPLIPIQIDNTPPVAQGQSSTAGPATYGNTSVALGSSTTRAGSTTSSALPANASAGGLPSIRGNLRRNSAIELQRVLKANEYYDGSLDGYYGPGTTSAYEAAWNDMATIKKYRRLSVDVASTNFMTWPEARVLHTIASDIGAGQVNQQIAATASADRARLFQASQPESAATSSRAQAWHLTLWEGLERWAVTDPLHTQTVKAFRVAYFQTLVRAEDYFMDRGFNSEQAKNMAMVSLQAIVGAELQRFL